MRFFRSIPKEDGQREFFSDYARFARSIAWLIIGCQVISGLTEAVIFYQLGQDTFIHYGMEVANIIGITFAGLGILMIEIFGLRFMLPQCSKQFIYKRFNGAHLWMTVFISIITFLLIGASYFLSIKGSSYTISSEIDKNEDKQGARIQEGHGMRLGNIGSDYKIDSLEIEQRYAAIIQSSNNKYTAASSQAQEELTNWASKKGNYTTRMSQARSKIKGIEANRATDISVLTEKKAMEQKALRDALNSSKDSLQAVLTVNLSDTETKLQRTETVLSNVGLIAVLLAITVSIICVVLKTMYEKGSGQREVAQPSDYHFRESWMKDAIGAVGERWETWIRNSIVNYRAKTPQSQVSQRMNTIYDREGLTHVVVKLEVEQLSDAERTIQIAAPKIEQPRRIGFHKDESSVTNATVTNAVSHKCDHCGTAYEPKVKWQRFCKKACKMEWHSNKHGGTPFNPKFRK